MKKRKFQKKISLNKETIADLNQIDLNSLKGGETVFPCQLDLTGGLIFTTNYQPITSINNVFTCHTCGLSCMGFC